MQRWIAPLLLLAALFLVAACGSTASKKEPKATATAEATEVSTTEQSPTLTAPTDTAVPVSTDTPVAPAPTQPPAQQQATQPPPQTNCHPSYEGACLDLNASEVTVDVLRDQGFLQGFGVDVADINDIGDEKDARIVGNDVTDGSEAGGRTAMENLLQKDPGINLIYTINEPAAAGAYEALKAAGKEKDVLITSVDGGCPGVENVKAGVIGATSMQFPLKMASLGVDAVVEFAKSGAKPEPSPGLDFVNTGVELITDQPVDGVTSNDSAFGLENCWG